MECNFKSPQRVGLYLVMIVILLRTCTLDTSKLDKKLDELGDRLTQIEQKLK